MKSSSNYRGFTLIEILVVLTIIAILLTLVTPRYFDAIDRSKEKVLQHDLLVMRNAIDQFYSDKNAYPDSLQDLVDERYLRQIPIDPMTDRVDTWITTKPDAQLFEGQIADIHSGSEQVSSHGTVYADW